MEFKLVNRNNHIASAYVIKDGYSRNIQPYGYIVLGELSNSEIAMYKKYSVVGLYLEIVGSNKSVFGTKGQQNPHHVDSNDSKAVFPVAPTPAVSAPVAPAPVVQTVPEAKAVAPKEEAKEQPVQEKKEEPKAVAVEKKEADAEESSENGAEKPIDQMTSAELKSKATELGLDISEVKKKTVLRDLIKQKLGL